MKFSKTVIIKDNKFMFEGISNNQPSFTQEFNYGFHKEDLENVNSLVVTINDKGVFTIELTRVL